MACPDENVLLEYADGLLSPERTREIAEHLVGCADCRAVLVGVAKAGPETIAATQPSKAATVAPPRQLLRNYLAGEAANRESLAGNVQIATELVTIAITTLGWNNPSTPRPLLGVMVALLCWSLPAKLAISRGRYHPAISFLNTLIEAIAPGAALLVIGVVRQPEAAFRSPGYMIWSTLIMASCLRVRPSLSIAAGAVGALFNAGMWLYLAPRFIEHSSELRPELQVMRSALLLLAGFAGAGVAKVMVESGERALKAVREQDLMGKYVLHEQVGKGGMAQVFRATYCPEGGFEKTVAVKRVRPELSRNSRFVQMFLEEARLCATLVHPNLVQVHDCGRFRDAFILAMEFVDGAPLSRVIDGRKLPASVVSYVGAELARALDYVHNKRAPDGSPLRLVHRDINPPNVLVSKLGEVKLADFGVAFASVRQQVGERDGFYGKVAYASPEQLALQPLDGRSDLFLLGLTMKEMLTGGTRGPMPDDVPAPLRALIGRLLEERREQRPASALAVHAELSQFTGDLAPYPGGAALLAEAIVKTFPFPSGPSGEGARRAGEGE